MPELRLYCVVTPLMALASLGVGACASSPQPMTTEALLGCWYFDQEVAPEGLRLPWGVRLTEEPVEGWPALRTLDSVRVAETFAPDGPRDFPIGYWRATAGGDSLEMGYPAGGGLVLRLAVPREGGEAPVLTGTARSVGDAVDPGGQSSGPEPGEVRLTWARCP